MRRLARHPAAQFLAAGCLAVLLVVLVTGRLSRSAADEEATDDARATTEVLARSVVGPALPSRLSSGEAGPVDRLDRALQQRLDVPGLERIKIWAEDGTIVYSDETLLVGSRYELDEEELDVLRGGGTEAELSDVSRPENRYERDLGGVLEVYTRVESPEGEALLFEAYYSTAGVGDRADAILSRFRPVTLVGLGALVAVALPLIMLLTRRLGRAAEQRERLLRAAVDASDAERTRIARDLHDGVVQELAGTSYVLTSIAARPDTGSALRTELDDASSSVRGSVRALRSLLVEIYPPDLDATGLAGALDDLLAPLGRDGVTTSLAVQVDDDLPPHLVALTWRTVQEAVRNAVRHGGGAHLDVSVQQTPDEVVAVVRDDGCGFDVTAPLPAGHLGLRGVRSLVEEAGGSWAVESAPGAGTTVRMQVPLP
ncbi:sensor histidine kinase [Nocardioides aquaticus]